MGCDYYVELFLKIEHADGDTIIKLKTIRGYYGDFNTGPEDSDYEEADDIHGFNSEMTTTLWNNFREVLLTPRNPLLIFDNGLFTKESYKEKYIDIIEDKIKESGKHLQTINDIVKIYKYEKRIER